MTVPVWAWAATLAVFAALIVADLVVTKEADGNGLRAAAVRDHPVLPSETAIIALGVATAGSTDPRIVLLIACAAAGPFLGDNLSYLLGRRFAPAVERRFFSSGKGARRRAWAEHSPHRFGMQIIIVCRFIPGGGIAVTLSCGLIGYPRRRLITATAAPGIIWAL